MNGKQRKNGFGWLLAVGGFFAVLIAGISVVFYGAGEFLVHADELRRSGAVVLLSGGDTERLDEAALLMRDRYADLLLLTDTDQSMPDGTLDGMPVGQYMRLELISRGGLPAQIEMTHSVVGSTREEAQAVREFLQRHKISSCIVVTDPFHTRRTRIIFMREMEGSGIEVDVIPARGHWYRAGTWFLSWRGWQATVSEFIKLGVLYF